MSEEKEIQVNLEREPQGKTPKNFLVLIIGVAVGAVLVAMWLGGGKKNSAPVVEKSAATDSNNNPQLFQQLIDQQEKDAEARRKARQEEESVKLAAANERAKQQPAALGSGVVTNQAPAKSQKEIEMAQQAAMSPIIALKGSSQDFIGSGGTRKVSDNPQVGVTDVSAISDNLAGQYAAKFGGGSGDKKTLPGEDFLQQISNTQDKADQTIQIKSAPTVKTLFQGSIIPAVLNTGLSSDVPGMVTATSTSNVYDNVTGGTIIIPAGTKFVGAYDTQVASGQERIMFAFTRMIFPDGRSAVLSAMQGAGENGMSGASGDVNTHFWQMLGSGLLIAGLSTAVDTIAGKGTTSVTNVYGGGGSSSGTAISSGGQVLVQTANTALQRYQNMKPTITVPAASPLNIMVNRDIVLP